MNVKSIFKMLITVVACVMIGAFILNLIVPNAAKALVNSTEQMIFNATGMSFDFNNDGTNGKSGGGMDFTGNGNQVGTEQDGGQITDNDAVEGFN